MTGHPGKQPPAKADPDRFKYLSCFAVRNCALKPALKKACLQIRIMTLVKSHVRLRCGINYLAGKQYAARVIFPDHEDERPV